MVVVQAFEHSGDVQHGVPPPGGHRLPQAGLVVLLFNLYVSFLVTSVVDPDSNLDPVVPYDN
jgi:hypothetical protein